MKLYHGSTLIVDKALVSYGRDNLILAKAFTQQVCRARQKNGSSVLFPLVKKAS